MGLEFISRSGKSIPLAIWHRLSRRENYCVLKRIRTDYYELEARWLGVWLTTYEKRPAPFVVTFENLCGPRNAGDQAQWYCETEEQALNVFQDVEQNLCEGK